MAPFSSLTNGSFLTNWCRFIWFVVSLTNLEIILWKGVFQSRLSPSLQLRFMKCWELGSHWRPCCHKTRRAGGSKGAWQYHQLCRRHNTSKDNILVRWLSKSDLLNKVVLVMPHYLQHLLFRHGFVQQCSVSPVIQACSVLVDIDTVSEVVQVPGFHVALNPATIRKS